MVFLTRRGKRFTFPERDTVAESTVSKLLTELKDYHDFTGDARAGALVAVLYDANESMQTDGFKESVKSREAAEKEAAKDAEQGE